MNNTIYQPINCINTTNIQNNIYDNQIDTTGKIDEKISLNKCNYYVNQIGETTETDNINKIIRFIDKDSYYQIQEKIGDNFTPFTPPIGTTVYNKHDGIIYLYTGEIDNNQNWIQNYRFDIDNKITLKGNPSSLSVEEGKATFKEIEMKNLYGNYKSVEYLYYDINGYPDKDNKTLVTLAYLYKNNLYNISIQALKIFYPELQSNILYIPTISKQNSIFVIINKSYSYDIDSSKCYRYMGNNNELNEFSITEFDFSNNTGLIQGEYYKSLSTVINENYTINGQSDNHTFIKGYYYYSKTNTNLIEYFKSDRIINFDFSNNTGLEQGKYYKSLSTVINENYTILNKQTEEQHTFTEGYYYYCSEINGNSANLIEEYPATYYDFSFDYDYINKRYYIANNDETNPAFITNNQGNPLIIHKNYIYLCQRYNNDPPHFYFDEIIPDNSYIAYVYEIYSLLRYYSNNWYNLTVGNIDIKNNKYNASLTPNYYGEVFNYEYNVALGNYSHAEGYITTASGNYGSHTEGKETKALGECSHAEGYITTASGNYGSHAEGSITTASGDYSHTEGDSTTASGNYGSHAEGSNTTASGIYGSHAEGNSIEASGDYGSHTEGNSTEASGDYGSHAEGRKTLASGNYGSHAEGNSTEASGIYGSHAEGRETKASGIYGSHAEGRKTKASGSSSHAEGRETEASGNSSHVEGFNTTANDCSHAEGNSTIASGSNSHASGIGTIANNVNMTAIGLYNDTSDNNEQLFVVGNGNNSVSRNNAFFIKSDGSAYIQNKLYINKLPENIEPIYKNGKIITDNSTIYNSTYNFAYNRIYYYTITQNNEIQCKEYNPDTNTSTDLYSLLSITHNDLIFINGPYMQYINKNNNGIYDKIYVEYINSNSSISNENYPIPYSYTDQSTTYYLYKNGTETNVTNYTFTNCYDVYNLYDKYNIYLLKLNYTNTTTNKDYVCVVSMKTYTSYLPYSYFWEGSTNYVNNYNKYISIKWQDNDPQLKESGFFVSYYETNDESNNKTYIIKKDDEGHFDETNKIEKEGFASISRYGNNIFSLLNMKLDNNNYIIDIYSINNNDVSISNNISYTINLPNNAPYHYNKKSIYYDGYVLYIIETDNNNHFIQIYNTSSNLLKEIKIPTNDGKFYQYKNDYIGYASTYNTIFVSNNNNDYILLNSYYYFNHIGNPTIFYDNVIFNQDIIYQGQPLPVPNQQNNNKLIKNSNSSNDNNIISACNDNNYIYTLSKDDNYYYIYKQGYNNKASLLKYLLISEYNEIKNIYFFNDNLLLLTNDGIYYINLLSENLQLKPLFNDNNINKLVISPDNMQLYVLYNSYDYYRVYDISLTIKYDNQVFISDNYYIQEDLDIINMIFYENHTYFIHNLYNSNYIIYSDYSDKNNIIRKKVNILLSNDCLILDSYVYENYLYLLLKNNNTVQLLQININTDKYNLYDNIIIDELTELNKYIYYKYNSEYFYLISKNYIYYYNVSDNLLQLENKLYVDKCRYITNNQSMYITNTNMYKFTNNFIVNGDILLNGQIKTSTLNATQLNLTDIDVNINKTIVHNTLIDGDINNYHIGEPVFLVETQLDNKIYSLERQLNNNDKYPLYKYIEINNNNYLQNTVNQMPKITNINNGSFIGVITAIYPANTPLKINEITSNYIKIDNDTIDFATHGDYVFKVDNNQIEHETTTGRSKKYAIGDEILYNGKIVDPTQSLSRNDEKMIIGTITYIPNNIEYISVFKN